MVNLKKIAAKLSGATRVRLFKGLPNPVENSFIPGHMSVHPWQAIQYGNYVYEATLGLRKLDSDEMSVWGRDGDEVRHSYFDEKPGVFDAEIGEAIVNVPIIPKQISGHDLVKAFKESPDFLSHHECDDERILTASYDLFGDALPEFIEWFWQYRNDDDIHSYMVEEVEQYFSNEYSDEVLTMQFVSAINKLLKNPE